MGFSCFEHWQECRAGAKALFFLYGKLTSSEGLSICQCALRIRTYWFFFKRDLINSVGVSFARARMCHECSGALFFFSGMLVRSGGRFHTSRACAKVSACAIWAINFAVEGMVVPIVGPLFRFFVTLLCVCVYVEWS